MEKAHLQRAAALLVFLGHFIVPPPAINEGQCALTLTHSTLETHFPPPSQLLPTNISSFSIQIAPPRQAINYG